MIVLTFIYDPSTNMNYSVIYVSHHKKLYKLNDAISFLLCNKHASQPEGFLFLSFFYKKQYGKTNPPPKHAGLNDKCSAAVYKVYEGLF